MQVESAGLFAVAIFFILSSLTMVVAYRPRFSDGLNEKNIREFFQNRIARILPLLAFVAALRLLYAIVSEQDIIAEFLRFFLTGSGLFSLHLPGYVSSFVGAWSLGIELLFYMFFPIIFLLTGSARIRSAVLALILFIAGQQAIIILLERERLNELGEIEYWFSFATFLVYAPFFMAGILIEKLVLKKRFIYSVLGFISFLVAICYSVFWNERIVTNNGLFLTLSASCMLSILLIYNGTWHARFVPILRFAGDVSYPLYLIHWMVWFALGIIMKWFPISLAAKIPMAVVVSVVLAYFTYRFIDSPLRAQIRRWMSS